jgi:hypothetical protein
MKPLRMRTPQEEELLVEQNLGFLRDALEEMEKDAAALTRMGSYGHRESRAVFANGQLTHAYLDGQRVRMVSKPHRGAALIFGQLLDAVAVGFPLTAFLPNAPERLFLDDMCVGEVQVDGGGAEAVTAEDCLDIG